jgi:hypothetical protein
VGPARRRRARRRGGGAHGGRQVRRAGSGGPAAWRGRHNREYRHVLAGLQSDRRHHGAPRGVRTGGPSGGRARQPRRSSSGRADVPGSAVGPRRWYDVGAGRARRPVGPTPATPSASADAPLARHHAHLGELPRVRGVHASSWRVRLWIAASAARACSIIASTCRCQHAAIAVGAAARARLDRAGQPARPLGERQVARPRRAARPRPRRRRRRRDRGAVAVHAAGVARVGGALRLERLDGGALGERVEGGTDARDHGASAVRSSCSSSAGR